MFVVVVDVVVVLVVVVQYDVVSSFFWAFVGLWRVFQATFVLVVVGGMQRSRGGVSSEACNKRERERDRALQKTTGYICVYAGDTCS